MASELCSHVQNIDSVIFITYPEYPTKLHFNDEKVIGQAELSSRQTLIPILKKLSKEKDRKFLFIETSWGLSRFTPSQNNYLIPMWEQENWKVEMNYCDNFISVTKFGLSVFRSAQVASRFLPFPIQENSSRRTRTGIKNILHNAGSFGGDFRKGTPEAVRIFQKSGLGHQGVQLTISSIRPPDIELIEIVNENSEGIVFDSKLKDSWMENYQNMDLLLFPSRVEGHALAVLEAHSFGIPALVTDCAPINEYELDPRFHIRVAQRKGLRSFVDLDDGAHKLRSLMDIDYSAKSLEVLNIFNSNYSWKSTLKFYEAVFK